MPHEPDIRDEIDALLRKLEATMDETNQHPPPEPENNDRQDTPPAMEAEEKAAHQPPPTIMVYVFDAFTPPSSSPFAEWDALHMQTPAPEEQPWDVDAVESTLVAETAEPLWTDEDEDAIPIDVPPPPREEDGPPQHSRMRRRTVGLVIALVAVTLVALLIVALYILPLLTASASITLIPVQTPVHASTTLTVVTAGIGVSLSPGQVPGRLLSTLTLSGERTVATTGVGHQDALAAHGTLTFYNAALYAQIIPAGTLLTGADGVQVVTDSDAVVPAARYPTFGQTTVSAHALQVGPTGNIRVGDIYGPCCRVNVSATSSTFTGGQNARTYPMVTRSDLTNATNALTANLAQSVQAALSTQVHADETLIVPVPCTPQVQAGQQVGEEATHVTVQVSDTCTGETYSTQAVEETMTQAVTQAAHTQLGMGYADEGTVQVTVQHVRRTTGPHGSLMLEVTGTGIWAYQFTSGQLHTLATHLTGMSREQATAVLLATPGVSQVGMQVAGNSSTLPTDASRIHLLVLYQP